MLTMCVRCLLLAPPNPLSALHTSPLLPGRLICRLDQWGSSALWCLVWFGQWEPWKKTQGREEDEVGVVILLVPSLQPQAGCVPHEKPQVFSRAPSVHDPNF